MYFDIGIIVFLLIFAIVGYSKGFLQSLFGFLGVFAGFIIAFFLTKPVVTALAGSSIETFVSGLAAKWLGGIEMLSSTTIPSEEALVAALSEKLPAFIATALASLITPLIGENGDMTLAEILTPTFSNVLMYVAVYIALFIILMIVIGLLKALGKTLHNAPVIGAIDKLLGIVFGAAGGLLFIFLLLFVLTFFASSEAMAPVMNLLNQSKLGLFLYNNNILGIVLNSLLQQASELPIASTLPSASPAA